MLKDITVGEAQKLTAPAPFGLLSTLRADGATNLMAVSWWTYLSNHPPMLGVCLSNKGLSGTLIKESGEFALSVVGENLSQEALGCGRCSGRDENKAEKLNIALEKSSVVKPEYVKNSRVVFECVLKSCAEASDHTLYMGEIVAVHGDSGVKQLFAYNGYSMLGPVE